jgi:hypothetical protein
MSYITKTNLSLGPQFGSQMSQYAGLYSVSKRLNFEIKLFEEFIHDFRGVKLFDAFDLNHQRCSISDVSPNIQKYILKESIIDSDVFSIDNNVNWDIQGWFHLYHYWHEYRSDLLNIFKFKQEIYDQAKLNLDTIRNQEQYSIVSLHVRRGDYLQVASLNLSLDYYSEAISIFLEKFPYFKLLVFSDDIDWCKEYIVGENVFYSEHNSNYVDMCMMTMCDHNIIANSTFSWWGAYLNQNIDKIVVCPKNYIGPSDPEAQFINNNYFPAEWISLNSL